VNALKDRKFEEQIITDELDTNEVIIKILSMITHNPPTRQTTLHQGGEGL
jgi:hypothetical protein